MIKVEVHSTRAVIREQVPLTVGLRGAKVRFAFGADWTDLIKTAVFRQGEKTVAVADIGEEVTIPWEVLTLPGVPVQIGVYGIDAIGTVAIPTLWTQTAPVRPGADPEGDPSAEPTPGLWEQMQENLGSLEQLKTREKSSLVAAINEANRPVCLVTVAESEDGIYTSDYDIQAIRGKMDANVPVACYWYEKDAVLPPVSFQSDLNVAFAAVYDAVEYQVVINESGVDCRTVELMKDALPPPVYLVTIDSTNKAEQPFGEIVEAHRAGYDVQCNYKGYLLPLMIAGDTEYTFSGVVDTTSRSVVVRSNGTAMIQERSMAKSSDLPQKVSDLENDSGYLTKAPVTSVNGQTGKVTVPTPVRVIIEQLADGSYQPDPPHDELEELHDEGHLLYCQYGNLELPLTHTEAHFLTFSGVDGGNMHTVRIGPSAVKTTAEPLASGSDTDAGYDIRQIGKKIVNGGFSRIILLGDSITDGYGGTDYNGSRSNAKSTNTEGYCWGNVFKKYITERYGIPVENYGYHGSVAREQYDRVINVLNPTDLVIWLSGTNNRISSELFSDYESHIADYVQQIKSKVSSLVFIPCIPATLPGEERYKTTQDINDVALRSVYGSTYYIDLYSKYIEHCKAQNLDIADTMYDTLHPNDAGYLLMFRILCRELGLPLYFYDDFSCQGKWWKGVLLIDTGMQYADAGDAFASWDSTVIPVMQMSQYDSEAKTTLFSGKTLAKIQFGGKKFTPGTLTIGTMDLNTRGSSCVMENAITFNAGTDGVVEFGNGFAIPEHHTLAIGAVSDTARLYYFYNTDDHTDRVDANNYMHTAKMWREDMSTVNIAIPAKFYLA